MLKKAVYIREHMSIEGRNFNWTPGYTYGKVRTLFSMIDDTNAPPTRHQLEFLDEVRIEFKETLEKVNSLVTKEITALNQTMQEHSLPTILAGKPIELP